MTSNSIYAEARSTVTQEKRKWKKCTLFHRRELQKTIQYKRNSTPFSSTGDFKWSVDKALRISLVQDKVYRLCQSVSVQTLTLQFSDHFFTLKNITKIKAPLNDYTKHVVMFWRMIWYCEIQITKRQLNLCTKEIWFLPVRSHPLHQLRHWSITPPTTL